jgi:ribonuclease HI
MNPHPALIWAYVDGSGTLHDSMHLSGVGVAFCDRDGELLTIARPVSRSLSSSYLERLAILTCLEIAAQLQVQNLIIYSDSEHSIKQIMCEKRATPGLADVTNRARRLLRCFAYIELVWFESEANWRAHGLARKACRRTHDSVWSRRKGAIDDNA